MASFTFRLVLFSIVLSLGAIADVLACSCGPFVVPSPCELMTTVEASADQDFVAIVNLRFEEEVDYLRYFSIEVEEVLAGIAIPEGSLFESYEGAACGQYLSIDSHYGLLVGRINNDGRVVPSACQPEDSFFSIVNNEVVLRAAGKVPERRFAIEDIKSNNCFKGDAESKYYVGSTYYGYDLLDIKSKTPISGPVTFAIFNITGSTINAEAPLAPFDTRSLASGMYLALIRDEEGESTVPFMVLR